jgi:glutamate synthase domain-containing protein 3
VQADGQLKTGRDVIIAALLGAEEFGFATAPLVVSGCIMMRVCHLDTCPVGVATQNPELRKRFDGRPEYVVNFMRFVAEEVREHLARLGFRTLAEAVGHAELLDTDDAVRHWKTEGLDLSPIFHSPELPEGASRHRTKAQDHGLDKALDNTLIQLCEGALRSGDKVRLDLPVRNVNRTVGTMLGHHLTRRWGGEGLPDDTIDVTLTGSAGQSFGAFVPEGITLRLVGDSNDFFGKGLSGGRLTLRPDPAAPFRAEENVIAGNVILYGATSGEIFVRGVVGERFCVRNSGALAVVEGVGDHGCEYMTGRARVVLGRIGRNFAAGMSGGHGYVLDSGRTAADQPRWSTSTPRRRRRAFLREPSSPLPETDSAVAPTADRLGRPRRRFGKVMPKDYKRVLRRPRAPSATAATWTSDHGGAHGDPKGFLNHPASCRSGAAVTCAAGLAEVYEEFRRELETGRALHELRHPVLPPGLPAGQPDPGVERPGLPARLAEAIERLHATNNFPEFTGTLCPAPCEAACVLAINSDAVTIKQVEVEIVDRAWEEGWVPPQPAAMRTGKKVAVVGSGPAGLAAAQQLTRVGHEVTCSSGPTGSAGCCATASPSSRWRSPGWTGGWPR